MNFLVFFALFVTLPSDVFLFKKFYKAFWPDIHHYNLVPFGETVVGANREFCLSICVLEDYYCKGFAYNTTSGTCHILKTRTRSSGEIEETYDLYLVDKWSPEEDTCGQLMTTQQIATYISDEDPSKYIANSIIDWYIIPCRNKVWNRPSPFVLDFTYWKVLISAVIQII